MQLVTATIGVVATALALGLTTDDASNTAVKTALWAVGALVGYNFGPATFSVWATQEVSAKASNTAAAAAAGVDPSTVNQGTTVFATLSYRLWAPDAPAQPAMYRK